MVYAFRVPDDAFDDDEGFGAPLPPDDRIWRHPSEVGGFVQAARRRREISNGKLLGYAATASLLGSVITVGALAAGGAFDRTVVERTAPRTLETVTPSIALPIEGAGWPQIVQQLAPSVTRLEGHGSGSTTTEGTAVALFDETDGTYFVTSLDLVKGVDRVTLSLASGGQKRAALIGVDQYTNLAVLFLDGEHVRPARFTTDEPEVGAEAVVVGAAAAGADSPTVAKALVGSVATSQRHPATGVAVENLIRTDANVSADAKGGALVDADGAVAALVVLMQKDDAGQERFPYALSMRVVTATADSLIRTGFPTQVWLGISGMDITAEAAVAVGVQGGALLTNVAPDSPAARCPLAAGDVVTKVNQVPITSMARLVMALRELSPTDTVAIESLRAGTPQLCYTELARPPEALPGVIDGSDGSAVTTTTTAVAGVTTVPSTETTVAGATTAPGPAPAEIAPPAPVSQPIAGG